MVREAEYYIARSAFELRKNDAQIKLEAYQTKYPYATDVELTNLYIGILEYESGRFKQAIPPLFFKARKASLNSFAGFPVKELNWIYPVLFAELAQVAVIDVESDVKFKVGVSIFGKLLSQ